ncbi:MAG: hypothetical protein M1281_14890 [Chloroflexi bacterium]|nr:hypothetical protein [Chloroflexota bacterium]
MEDEWETESRYDREFGRATRALVELIAGMTPEQRLGAYVVGHWLKDHTELSPALLVKAILRSMLE